MRYFERSYHPKDIAARKGEILARRRAAIDADMPRGRVYAAIGEVTSDPDVGVTPRSNSLEVSAAIVWDHAAGRYVYAQPGAAPKVAPKVRYAPARGQANNRQVSGK